MTLNGVVSNGRFAVESGTIIGAALAAPSTSARYDNSGATLPDALPSLLMFELARRP